MPSGIFSLLQYTCAIRLFASHMQCRQAGQRAGAEIWKLGCLWWSENGRGVFLSCHAKRSVCLFDAIASTGKESWLEGFGEVQGRRRNDEP